MITQPGPRAAIKVSVGRTPLWGGFGAFFLLLDPRLIPLPEQRAFDQVGVLLWVEYQPETEVALPPVVPWKWPQ